MEPIGAEMTEPIIHPPKPEWLDALHFFLRVLNPVPSPIAKRVRIAISPEEWVEYKQWQRDMGYVTATRAILNYPIDIVSGEPETTWELF